jgi:cytochrome c peroxidase
MSDTSVRVVQAEPLTSEGWAPFGQVVGRDDCRMELRGEAVFHGRGKCASCHTPPFYTDNLMHDLRTERFFAPRMINGHLANGDGPIKTFPLRGIKDSPPYFHDGRLLTLEDVVEFFDLVLETRLAEQEKKDLVAFMCAL